jgi:ornithine cyclodeaminase/alanine dehydrogenase-like protein (mu-crystallin family)
VALARAHSDSCPAVRQIALVGLKPAVEECLLQRVAIVNAPGSAQLLDEVDKRLLRRLVAWVVEYRIRCSVVS